MSIAWHESSLPSPIGLQSPTLRPKKTRRSGLGLLMKRARVTRDYLTRQVSAKATTDISRVIKAATNPAKANFFIRFTSPCCCATREAQLIFRSHIVHCDGNNHAVFP